MAVTLELVGEEKLSLSHLDVWKQSLVFIVSRFKIGLY